MRDVGRVEDTFAEPTTWNMVDGKESVKLDVRRQSGTNTVQIVNLVRGKLTQIQKTLPAGVDIKIIADKSIFIDASVAALKEHLLYGSLLASLVVSALHTESAVRGHRFPGHSDLDCRDIHAD